MIRKLMLAGADAFRINMSHGDQKQKAKLVEAIRALEKEFHRPTTILFDLQGPKLRVGRFEGGAAMIAARSRALASGSGRPIFAATVISRLSLEKRAERFLSCAPFRYMMFLYLLCPAMAVPYAKPSAWR